MKKLLIPFFVLFLFASCESTDPEKDEGLSTEAMIQAEAVSNFTCINKQADNAIPVADAKAKIVGEWQLKTIISMLPSNQIPNIVLKIDQDLAVKVFLAGKEIHTDKLSFSTEFDNVFRNLVIQSSRQEFSNGDFNFLYGNLRVCDSELFIDNGIAFDAPGYLFRKK